MTTSDPLDTPGALDAAPDGEAKPDAEVKEGEEAKADEPNPLFGAPEGDYEITGLPEGMTLDAEAMGVAAPLFKELGLSNEGASKVAQVYAEKILPNIEHRAMDAMVGRILDTRKAWDAETTQAIQGGKDAEGKAVAPDPIYAGKSKDDVLQVSAKALDRFGGQPFREFLKETGLSNHPAMVKFAYLAGSQLSEDGSLERGTPLVKPLTEAEKFYGPRS